MKAARRFRWWPLHKWTNRVGVSSVARREVILGGSMIDPNETSLEALREFVARLDRWPGHARGSKHNRSVLHVTYFEKVDDLIVPVPPNSGAST